MRDADGAGHCSQPVVDGYCTRASDSGTIATVQPLREAYQCVGHCWVRIRNRRWWAAMSGRISAVNDGEYCLRQVASWAHKHVGKG